MANRALEELQNIGTGWVYPLLSKLASVHNDPETLIKDVYANGYEDGYRDGYIGAYSDGYADGVIETLKKVVVGSAVIAVTAWGITTWKKYKKNMVEIDRLAKEGAKLKAEEYLAQIKITENTSEIYTEGNVIYGAFAIDNKAETPIAK
jgi:hypothetical protein